MSALVLGELQSESAVSWPLHSVSWYADVVIHARPPRAPWSLGCDTARYSTAGVPPVMPMSLDRGSYVLGLRQLLLKTWISLALEADMDAGVLIS